MSLSFEGREFVSLLCSHSMRARSLSMMVGSVTTSCSFEERFGKTRALELKIFVLGREAGGVSPSLRLVCELVSGWRRQCLVRKKLTICFAFALLDGSGEGSLSPPKTPR